MIYYHYRNMLVLASVASFYTGLPNLLHQVFSIGLPIYWVIGFGLLSLPLLMKEGLKSDSLNSPVIIWCFGYALVSIIWFLLSSQSDMAWQEMRYRGLTLICLLMFLGLFANADLHRFARQALVAGVLFGVAVNVYELTNPTLIIFLPPNGNSMGRSAGLYMNPNVSGSALLLGMIVATTVLPSLYRAPFMLLTGMGVFLTFSRADILGWLLAVAGLMLMGKVKVKSFLLSCSLSLLLAALILVPQSDQILTSLEREGVLNENVMERMAWFLDPSGVEDYSSWERQYLLKQAWEKIADHPFIGSGTGSYLEAYTQPHNQYISFMLDHGLLGAAILPLLILVVTWNARRENRHVVILFGVMLMFLGFFSHNILNGLHILLLLSLIAAMAAMSPQSEITRMQIMTTGEMDASKNAVVRSAEGPL